MQWEWDKKLFLYLNGLGKEKWDSFWLFIGALENWIIFYGLLAFLILYLFGFKKSLLIGLSLILMMICVYLFSMGMKFLFQKPRPCETLVNIDSIRILVTNCKKFSFPSNHACLHFALAIFLGKLIFKPYLFVWLFLWAVLIAYSRIYLGAHYPSDVLVGMFIGIFFGYLFFYFYKYLENLKVFDF
jgi:undecaprenyl-diphosphatase